MITHYDNNTCVITQEPYTQTYLPEERKKHLKDYRMIAASFVVLAFYFGSIKDNLAASTGFFLAALGVSHSYGLKKDRDECEDKIASLTEELYNLKVAALEPDSTLTNSGAPCCETEEVPMGEMTVMHLDNLTTNTSAWLDNKYNGF